MKAVALSLILLINTLSAGTPTETLTAFQRASKDQNFEEAWKYTAKFDGASEEITNYFKYRIHRILKISAKGWSFEILEEKIIGDCAVVVINESTEVESTALNIDPVYLIKQQGEWRVMPNFTQWNPTERISADKQSPSMRLDEAKIAAYNELEKWLPERKKALRDSRQSK